MTATPDTGAAPSLNPPAWFEGVDHVGWTVTDLEAVVDFYCRAFGAREIFRMGPMAAADLPEGPTGRDWMADHVNVPGATLTLCDGFMTTQTHSAFTRLCYQKTCHHWALGHFPDLHQVTARMAELGFVNIKVVDLSWRVLPSALFVPWMIIKYGLKLLCRGDRNPQHWHHLLAPLWGLGLAMNRKAFGYYLVTGDKPDIKT